MATLRLSRIFNFTKGSRGEKNDKADSKPQVTDKALPAFDELPNFNEFKGCAWDVWGRDDQLGTINLLTPDVVQRAAREEIR